MADLPWCHAVECDATHITAAAKGSRISLGAAPNAWLERLCTADVRPLTLPAEPWWLVRRMKSIGKILVRPFGSGKIERGKPSDGGAAMTCADPQLIQQGIVGWSMAV
eukprot:Skav234148  [mRNA]  locus=scaffold2592:6033:6973:+ [translate_table: standard]